MNSYVQVLNNVKDVVRKIMEDSPQTRDNDNLLILKVWATQNEELRGRFYKFRDFSEDFLDSKYANTGSIIRMRAKLQEKNPSLRGAEYNKRHKIGVQTSMEINKL